jgi:threonine dehydrogenase-like Zn-dependent dehydrogenase
MKVDSSLELLGALLEPTTVVTKAWEQVNAIGRRSFWEPKTVLVTGAGPIGLLAALLGMQRGLDVHVLDRVDSGLKPNLVRPGCLVPWRHCRQRRIPARYYHRMHRCRTGHIRLRESRTEASSVLTGIGSGDRSTEAPTAGDIAAEVVLRNNVVVGSVNANKRHWYKASKALAKGDRSWLDRLITRRERPENFASALHRKDEDIKVVVQFTEA